MAKKKNPAAASSESIDWYLISIDRLKQIGLVVLLLLIGGGAYWFWTNQRGNPKTLAEGAITDARQALNTLASSKDFASHKTEFERAQKKLEEANGLFNAGKYPEAQSTAVESQTISRIGGVIDENDARFLTVEGDVQVQKSSTSDWKTADLRTPLMNGDWVKTADGASAELIFTNNSVYTMGPSALLEIYAQIAPGDSKKTHGVELKVGPVEVATTDEQSTIRTPGSQVIVDSASTTQVGVDKQSATNVLAMKGTAAVTSTAGGEAIKLAGGEKVTATPQGTISAVKKTLSPPALLGPGDSQVFQMTNDARIDFGWEPVPGAAAYQLEVSRSRLFSTLEINARRMKPQAVARVTQEGMFYWRVASIGSDGEVGPYSSFRRFRASGGEKGPKGTVPGGDTTPPALNLIAPFSISDRDYFIEGTTEPGASVFINGEEVEVESSGHFKKLITLGKTGRNDVIVKAVDPSGNPTVKSQTIVVREE